MKSVQIFRKNPCTILLELVHKKIMSTERQSNRQTW